LWKAICSDEKSAILSVTGALDAALVGAELATAALGLLLVVGVELVHAPAIRTPTKARTAALGHFDGIALTSHVPRSIPSLMAEHYTAVLQDGT
jgi:hypothetical protein